ncbi:tyrosine-protein phosphatase Yvh1p [Trichomonascus vanleenenianus]|uniref:tyrosine protein phosphatase YVH1 n=1 Tax=Trichomonascus vanleenenianus TaxID=2268995 RepID=UPI003ECA4D22
MAMHQITDQIWLGSLMALSGQKTMREKGITHVLSVLSPDLSVDQAQHPFFGVPKDLSDQVRGFTHRRFDVDDVEDENIVQFFHETYQYIDEALSKGEHILVHCVAGVSRSATVVCAYLMRKNFWDAETALEFVRSKRAIANPNFGFVEQLQVYYESGFVVDPLRSRVYRQWMLKKQSEEAQLNVAPNAQFFRAGGEGAAMSASLLGRPSFEVIPELLRRMGKHAPKWTDFRVIANGEELALEDAIPSTPTNIMLRKLEGEPFAVPQALLLSERLASDLRCKKCRQTLATSTQFLVHEPKAGAGTTNSTRNGLAANASVNAACTSYYIEPVIWMKGELEKGLLEGKLSCPKCEAKLGAYHWQGSTCSCGVWVTPAFSIQRGRVDEVPRLNRAKV